MRARVRQCDDDDDGVDGADDDGRTDNGEGRALARGGRWRGR